MEPGRENPAPTGAFAVLELIFLKSWAPACTVRFPPERSRSSSQRDAYPHEQASSRYKLDEAALLKIAAERNEFLNLHEIVAKARANLNQNAWDYIVGGVETETTLRRNRMALDSIAFRPRVLRDVSKVDASAEMLGRKLRLPIVLCPVGSLESFHPGGAEPVVKAAAEFGVAHMLSSVCDPGLEDVAQGRARCAAHVPALCARRRGLGRRSCRARDRQQIRGVLSHRRHRPLQPARARHRQAPHHRRPPPRQRPRFPDGARLAHRRAHQEASSRFRSPSRASPPRRTPRSRSITASRSSTSPITAAGSSITAAARSTCCRKSSRRSPAAP